MSKAARKVLKAQADTILKADKLKTKKVGDVIVNTGKGLKKPTFKQTKYSLSKSIEDSMNAAKTSGTAGAGQIVAVYNHGYFAAKKLPNGRPYNPLADYFTAPEVTERDEETGKVIRESRKDIQDNYLSRNCSKYKKLFDEYTKLDNLYKDAEKAKNAFLMSDYSFKRRIPGNQVNAARQLLHRTLVSLTHLYFEAKPTRVEFGTNNEISVTCIPNKDGSENANGGLFTASAINKKGTAYCVDEKRKWITPRGAQDKSPENKNGAVTDIPTPAVNATNAKTVMGKLEKLFENTKFNPPISVAGKKDSEHLLDKNDQAEFAIHCIERIKPQDLRHDELRKTLCQLFVNVSALLKVKGVTEAQKILNEATIKEIAA